MGIKVFCIETGKQYNSLFAFSKEIGVCYENVRKCVLENKNNINGFSFKILPGLSLEEKKHKQLENQRNYRKNNREKCNALKTNFLQKLRKQCEELLGGKCEKCGATENLEFHHKNKEEASFKLGSMARHSKKDVFNEVKKCMLLCHKCHWNEHRKLKITRKRRFVLCLETGSIYKNVSAAAKALNIRAMSIYNVCTGEKQTANSYHFKFIEPEQMIHYVGKYTFFL